MFLTKSLAALAALALSLAPALSAGAALPTADEPAGEVRWSVAPGTLAGEADRTAFTYSVNPGIELHDFVTITNVGAAAATFKLYGTDATNDFETGAFSLLSADEKPVDVGSWIHMDQPEVTLDPGAHTIVPFSLSIPTDAGPGEHVAGIVAAYSKPTTDSAGQAVVLDQRVGTRMYLTVSGAIAVSVEASGVTSGYNSPWNPFGAGSHDTGYSVTNTGNMRANVEQTLQINGPFGIPVASITLEPIKELLPGQSVHVVRKVPDAAPLLMLFSDITLNPSATVGDTPQTTGLKVSAVTASTQTLAVPWMLLVVILVLAGVIFGIVRYVNFSRDRFYDELDRAEALQRERGSDAEFTPAPAGSRAQDNAEDAKTVPVA